MLKAEAWLWEPLQIFEITATSQDLVKFKTAQNNPQGNHSVPCPTQPKKKNPHLVSQTLIPLSVLHLHLALGYPLGHFLQNRTSMLSRESRV